MKDSTTSEVNIDRDGATEGCGNSIPNEKIGTEASHGCLSRSRTGTLETICESSSDTGIDLEAAPQDLVADDVPGSMYIPDARCIEAVRDGLLRVLDGPFFQTLGLLVLLLVVIDGAFFFFLLVGWHRLCPPGTNDCDQRNYWYNFSVQVLTLLFTYSALISLPWRCANLIHLTRPSRATTADSSNATAGTNLQGLATEEPWFYIPTTRRVWLTTLLLWNSLFQFLNQASRIVYSDYESQSSFPGCLWTNLFFGLSFLCAAVAGAWIAWETKLLRQAYPGKFGMGPVDAFQEFYQTYFGGQCTLPRNRREQESVDEEEG